ncbi:glycerophosphodiester phosphodiesterase [Paenibacillus sp.]|uniref:glycerophosphodiester phosphodiesterase n=1 Tax=Paenibacillus sp. TaxID=58172 RepID=UPI002D631970|nr:glycerophosphodiester phosphodiesterase family protein [Paenibacillus sp.]HZG83879.1 glycerophosphodiester phosphodiesterase family protein [Paenibacillus sp.]
MANDIVAHRGWSAAAPENTMAAFRKALDAPYVAGLELDIQLSKDGVPVVIHDFTLGRTTTGQGFVKDHTLAELKALDAGAWFDPAFRGERIPTLAEALALAKGRAVVNIELKTAGGLYPGLAEAAVKVVRESGMENEVYFTSFDHLVMLEAKSIAPDIRTGLLVAGRPVAMKAQFEATGADVLSIAHPYITKDLVREAEELGIELLAWTVDDPARMRELAALSGRIAICTNAPDKAREALGL